MRSWKLVDLSASLFLRDRLEVLVNLLPVLRRRIVVGASGEPFLRLPCLELPGQGRLGRVQRLAGLMPEVIPLREVLLECLGAWCRKHHALSFEGEADSAALDRPRA